MKDLTAPANNSSPPRQWLASLDLKLAVRDGKTVLVTNSHYGPLRVQRPFYPERTFDTTSSECCHIYLLHPPGGLVLGDQLSVQIQISNNANLLVTTPSAGKVYGVQNGSAQQQQSIHLHADDGACIEWMPQETIAFNGANAHLTTQLHLAPTAKALIWDIVCLGRPAANEIFSEGCCYQTLEVKQGGRLLLVERNRFDGDSSLLKKAWGLNGRNTSGTLCATATPDRDFIDALLDSLNKLSPSGSHSWGITQKGELLIARYIGDSSAHCREGFTLIWKSLRPHLNGKAAVTPRIWNT